MAGPGASILLPELLTSAKKIEIFGYIQEISSQTRGRDFWYEDRPFIYVDGPEFENELQDYIDEEVPQAIGWTPKDSIGFAAMCNDAQDHRILGEFCLHFARELGGLINFGAALLREKEWIFTNCPGKLYRIYYEKHNGLNWYYHIGDHEFMEYWLQHPQFHMIK